MEQQGRATQTHLLACGGVYIVFQVQVNNNERFLNNAKEDDDTADELNGMNGKVVIKVERFIYCGPSQETKERNRMKAISPPPQTMHVRFL